MKLSLQRRSILSLLRACLPLYQPHWGLVRLPELPHPSLTRLPLEGDEPPAWIDACSAQSLGEVKEGSLRSAARLGAGGVGGQMKPPKGLSYPAQPEPGS